MGSEECKKSVLAHAEGKASLLQLEGNNLVGHASVDPKGGKKASVVEGG